MVQTISSNSGRNAVGFHANGAIPIIGGEPGKPSQKLDKLAGHAAKASGRISPDQGEEWLRMVLEDFRQDAVIFQDGSNQRLVRPNESDDEFDLSRPSAGLRPLGILPGLFPEWLGSQQLAADCGSRFSYVVGEMARGITSAEMVIAAVKSGFIGFYGSAGLRADVVRPAVRKIRDEVGEDAAWGANLIHSPDRPEMETALIDLCLEEGVRNISASAFMSLSREVVRFSAKGLHRGAGGGIDRSTRVFAKISRAEVAAPFLTPPPFEILASLVADGAISEQQADLQSRLPVAEFVTIEADSGGHTDGRPMVALMPVITALRDTLVARYGYTRPIYLGAAGGIGTPASAAAAYAMGADYIVTGSINQCAVESGLSEDARNLLCQAGIADMAIAPSADMFEIGAKVQVLKRGTMFAAKAQRLQELYRRHDDINEFSEKDRHWLEAQVLRETFEQAWQKTRDYHNIRSAHVVARAEGDSHLRMALVFKRYLFMGSQWARDGHTDRRIDYQIWCGPAMGAFNDWVTGSFLEAPENRTVAQIGLNILEGAARITRAQQLRSMGVALPGSAFAITPTELLLG